MILTFKYHINNIALKILRHTAFLYQIKDFMLLNVLKCLCCAHIYLLFMYCNPLWCATHSICLIPSKLQLQKNVWILTNSNYLDHIDPFFKHNNILKLDDITKLSIVTMYTKKNVLHSYLPSHGCNTRHCHHPCLHSLTQLQHQALPSPVPSFPHTATTPGTTITCAFLVSHSYNTWHYHHPCLPSHHLAKFQHSLAYLGPAVWNTTPPVFKMLLPFLFSKKV